MTDDNTYTKELPSNVKLIFTTLSEISSIATTKLGLDVNISYAYKLCDFKPAYGVIFSELLTGYDFWAFGDLDVIYGDIRNFITNELLESYELISVRPDWVPGCFSLFKNIEKMNRLYTYSKDYQKVFTSDKHYCFDETNFAHDEFTAGKSYKEIRTEIESMTHVVKKLEGANYIKSYFDLFIIEGLPGKLRWTQGKLTYRNRFEILLYHLIRMKKIYAPKRPIVRISGSFAISQTRIYHV